MTLTQEQQSICNYQFDKNVLIVNAFAGTGKTSTLVEFCKTKSKEENNPSMLYLCFNASIKREAETKFKDLKNITVKTTHGLAFPILFKKFKDTKRLGNLYVKHIISSKWFKQKTNKNKYAYAVIDLIRTFWRSEYTSLEDFITSYESNEYYFLKKHSFITYINLDGFEVPKEQYLDMNIVYENLRKLWDDYLNDTSKYPVEHDLYLKLYHISNPKLDNKYDYILVDEAQDLSPVVIDLVMKQTNSKRIFVGDKHQQIYSWRGARNAIQYIQDNYDDVEVKYLTTSFRCPSHVAEIANRILKLKGETKDFIGMKSILNDVDVRQPITYISRSNIAIISDIISNIKSTPDIEELKYHVIGGLQGIGFDLFQDLEYLNTGEKYKIKSSFLKSFKDWDSFIHFVDDTKDKTMKKNIEQYFSYIKEFKSIANMITIFNSALVNNQKYAKRIYTTAHKSKGLEWDQVSIMRDFKDLIEEDKNGNISHVKSGEELNLLYVAFTRSKRYIEIPSTLDIDEEMLQRCISYLNEQAQA